jgi:hypothetical protein
MLRGSRFTYWGLMTLFVLAGCPGGGGIGASCGGNDDCDGTLQCLQQHCVPRCERAPECGDGYWCDNDNLCQPATGQAGDHCESEVECAAGLSCQIDGAAIDSDNRPRSTCTAENTLRTRPAGAACTSDADCRNGTCALGQCVDLCRMTRDCSAGTSCASIPSELAANAFYGGCLPSKGNVVWSIPAVSPLVEVLFPVPDIARSVELVMSVDDPNEKVGAVKVLSPEGRRIYLLPCSSLLPSDTPCEDFYNNSVRHRPGFGQSVLAIPSGVPSTSSQVSAAALTRGIYRIDVSSFRSNDTPGFAVPTVTAVVQIDSGRILDLHFFFLDLADHPCAARTNNAPLNAMVAQGAPYFQDDYLGGLEDLVTRAGLSLDHDKMTYENITNHPELDGLDVASAGSLLALGRYPTGINIFFVRSLSPIGLQAFGPNPGPAGLGRTSQSGIIIGLDTLCYRDWKAVARLTAHEIARYMGLYHNVELETDQHPYWRDLIDDSDDSTNNLMFFSEHADPSAGGALRIGDELSTGQRTILRHSAVLR